MSIVKAETFRSQSADELEGQAGRVEKRAVQSAVQGGVW